MLPHALPVHRDSLARPTQVENPQKPAVCAAFLLEHNCLMAAPRAPRLIVVCGLPGSGKTTFAKHLETTLRAIRFSADDWLKALLINIYDEEKRAKIESLQWELAQQLLANGQIVIIEWGTWGRSERDGLRLGARALGAAAEVHYLHASVDELFARIHRRAMEDPPIERDAVERWFRQFQAPTPEEIALFDEPLVRT
jgi:predicted kinase